MHGVIPASPAPPLVVTTPGRAARRVRKYAAVAATSMRRGLAERAAIVSRIALYGMLLLIFSRLWRVVAERGAVAGTAIAGASSRDLLWYLAVTEWVILSVPLIHQQIERDVKLGDVAALLPRPISYLGARLAESAGDFLLRATTLAIAGCMFATLLTGGLPDDPRGLLFVLPLGLAAGWVAICFQAAIGLSAVWLRDSTPVFWIWQKCSFVLGGLMLPLEVYPDWLRRIALLTPFAALLNGPGRMAFGWQPRLAGQVALQLLLWSAVAGALLVGAYARARRALEVSGG
jgi:ABC-2 type transport system permease protein